MRPYRKFSADNAWNPNIETGGIRIREGFGLIDKWRIIERSPTDNRMISLEITLSDWLYNAILTHEVLTLHRDYFRLDGGLERRLYELCRKHCGNQETWSIHLPLLHKKSGARSELKWFRFALHKLVAKDELPEYRLTFNPKTDKLTAYPKTHKGCLRQLKDTLGL